MNDKTILRELAKRYLETTQKPVMDERRKKWRDHNSLKAREPLIYVRGFAFREMPESQCLCEDPFLRGIEWFFRHSLYWDSLDDDAIFEPWVTVNALNVVHGWGVEIPRQYGGPRGSFKEDYPLRDEADLAKLQTPAHVIDEEGTAREYALAQDVLGDILAVNLSRASAWGMWSGDISTDLGHLRGMEHFMLDMHDRPEWLRRLVKFMGDGILNAHAQTEAAGDWGLADHQNQAMPYARELPDPAANARGVPRKQLWRYMSAQEFALVSPGHHEEFLLRYQLPILEKFGLVAYGCCEDLTHKIEMLRKIPNLRRIAVSPFADVEKCAGQIGRDYVASYRPSPVDMVAYSWDPERVRRILDRDFAALARHNCVFDVTLKDVETVGHDPDRVRNWVRLTRERIAENVK